MCGIVGIVGHPEASNLTYLGLYALQHRGQESAGIVSTDGQRLYKIRRRSLVSEAFDTEAIEFLKGQTAIGHVRYSTTGGDVQRNVQPFIAAGSYGDLSVAHNGNITNFRSIRRRLEQEGSIFQSTMDSEIILHLVARAPGSTLVEKIQNGLREIEGAFSLLFLTKEMVIAVRDPRGFRPLALGHLGNSPVVASETCAFDLIGAKLDREIEPGEMLAISRNGKMESVKFGETKPLSQCVFEHIYFARPDSQIFGTTVYGVRHRLGRELAKEHPLAVDVVTPVPDSGAIIAIGYSEQSGIPMQMGFIRNHYVGRTFIEPKQSIRDFGVRVKLNPVPGLLTGKRVVVIDDSIVRGSTSRKIVKMIRDSGAKEVHMRVASPPLVSPCYYGIDIPTREELIGSNKSVKEIESFIGADSLQYLSLEGVYRAVQDSKEKFCDACFSRRYPTPIENGKA